jgi:transposase
VSLRPAEIAPVPAAIVLVAKAAFPKGCPAMRMRDELGAIYDDQMFASVYPARGQPALPPWRLALVTVLQFAEGLPDRQAANAVRGRIDWKYALGLELADPGLASRPGEFHPQALLEPCLNLSVHTAPDVRP